MKSPKVKSDLQVRAALRASEERRLDHAYKTFNEMLDKHSVSERECEHDRATIHILTARLMAAIKNQHVKDRCIANARQKWIEQGGY